MKIRGIDFVVYQVSDLGRAATFYREVLGLRQTMFSKAWEWVEFDCGNVTLALLGGNPPPGTSPGGRIALAVDDVLAAAAELKEKGVHIGKEAQNYSVCWAVEIFDPDENTVILHQRADGTFGNQN